MPLRPSKLSTRPRVADPEDTLIGMPRPFHGNPADYTRFKQSLEIFHSLHEGVFDTDSRKIFFVLSLMEEGPASTWRNLWMAEHRSKNSHGSYAEFMREFDERFDVESYRIACRHKLKLMRPGQGGRTAQAFVLEFKCYVTSGYGAKDRKPDDAFLVDLFIDALHPGLLNKILSSEEVPETLDEWYKKAIERDQAYRWVKELQAWRRDRDPKEKQALNNGVSHAAMQGSLGCFRCGDAGHFIRDCTKRNPNYKGKNYDPNYHLRR